MLRVARVHRLASCPGGKELSPKRGCLLPQDLCWGFVEYAEHCHSRGALSCGFVGHIT